MNTKRTVAVPAFSETESLFTEFLITLCVGSKSQEERFKSQEGKKS